MNSNLKFLDLSRKLKKNDKNNHFIMLYSLLENVPNKKNSEEHFKIKIRPI